MSNDGNVSMCDVYELHRGQECEFVHTYICMSHRVCDASCVLDCPACQEKRIGGNWQRYFCCILCER